MMEEFERYQEDENNLLDIISRFKELVFTNLKYLLIGFSAIFIIILLYLFTTPKEYNTYAKIKVLEEEETSAFVLEDMMNFDSPFKEDELLENEIEILKSKNILETVIKELRLTHNYSQKTILPNGHIDYNDIPFIASISKSDDAQEYIIECNSINKFTITNINDKTATVSFGKAFILDGDTITIDKSLAFNQNVVGEEYMLSISNPYSVFLALKEQITLTPITKFVLEFSLKGKDPVLNKLIIQTLLNAYNADGLADNKIIASSTASFLSERTALIKNDIIEIEAALSSIKKGNNIFDINAINEIFSSQALTSSETNLEIETQQLLAKSFAEKLKAHSKTELLPLPLEVGIQNTELATFTNEFNTLVIERNKLLKGRTTTNPEILLLNNQLNDLLSNINKSVSNFINNLKIKQNKISQFDSNLKSKFFNLNDTELSIVRFTRELEVKASILLFLLEKQEENTLTLAIESPTFKILDAPHTNYNSPSPNTKVTLILGLLLALVLPIILIYLKTALYSKITNKESLQKILNKNIPIIGEIPISSDKLLSLKNRGTLLESFRLIRANLSYISNPKTILVTSSIKGEGKTFTAINLAQSLTAVNNNKVLLIGCDLRNPQIHKLLDITKDQIGLTNYIINTKQEIQELIQKNEKINFDFILSGPIPPNPTELLATPRMSEIINYAKANYDYVIIDSAPCLLVSDTLSLTKLVDTTIYVTYSKVTELNLIHYINTLYEDKVVENMAIILNGIDSSNNNYGYKYGYKYGYNYGYKYGYSEE